MNRCVVVTTFVLCSSPVAPVSAAASRPPLTRTQRSITLAGARAAIDAMQALAQKLETTGVVAVVDAGGHAIAIERLDEAPPASSAIALAKARTAALFKKPTKVFEDIINKGRTAMLAADEVTGFTPMQGGLPIILEGQVAGAVGVSGAATPQQDEELATAAAAVFHPDVAPSSAPSPPSPTTQPAHPAP